MIEGAREFVEVLPEIELPLLGALTATFAPLARVWTSTSTSRSDRQASLTGKSVLQ